MFIALFAICRRGLIYDVSLPLWRLKGEPIYRQTERRAPKNTYKCIYYICLLCIFYQFARSPENYSDDIYMYVLYKHLWHSKLLNNLIKSANFSIAHCANCLFAHDMCEILSTPSPKNLKTLNENQSRHNDVDYFESKVSTT